MLRTPPDNLCAPPPALLLLLLGARGLWRGWRRRSTNSISFVNPLFQKPPPEEQPLGDGGGPAVRGAAGLGGDGDGEGGGVPHSGVWGRGCSCGERGGWGVPMVSYGTGGVPIGSYGSGGGSMGRDGAWGWSPWRDGGAGGGRGLGVCVPHRESRGWGGPHGELWGGGVYGELWGLEGVPQRGGARDILGTDGDGGVFPRGSYGAGGASLWGAG